MKVPEQPKENFDRSKDAPAQNEIPPPRAEVPREREIVKARADVVDATRHALEELARRLPRVEGARVDRFTA